MEERTRWIAVQNVDRFKRRLASETDPEKRHVLRRLLDEEQGRLSKGKQAAGLSAPDQ